MPSIIVRQTAMTTSDTFIRTSRTYRASYDASLQKRSARSAALLKPWTILSAYLYHRNCIFIR